MAQECPPGSQGSVCVCTRGFYRAQPRPSLAPASPGTVLAVKNHLFAFSREVAVPALAATLLSPGHGLATSARGWQEGQLSPKVGFDFRLLEEKPLWLLGLTVVLDCCSENNILNMTKFSFPHPLFVSSPYCWAGDACDGADETPSSVWS